MGFLQVFNAFSKNVFGVAVVDVWTLAPLTKTEAKKARSLSESKHLRQAITTAQKALAPWSKQPGFWRTDIT